MRKVKYLIPVVILFLTIGFASVNSSLSMNGDTIVNSDIDDFNVYFSNVLVNGERDLSIVQSSTQLDFSTILEDLGNTYVIEYEITNGSSAFDANVSINCSDSNEYLEVSNDFDSEEPIETKQSRVGTLTLKKIKVNAGEIINNRVSCSILAEPIERNSTDSSDAPDEFKTIMFSIDGTSYEAIKGMSFDEWSRSVYNIDNKVLVRNTKVYYEDEIMLLSSDMIIESGMEYYSLSNLPYISVGSIETKFDGNLSDLVLVTYDKVNDYLLIMNMTSEKVIDFEFDGLIKGTHYELIDENYEVLGNEWVKIRLLNNIDVLGINLISGE